MKTWRSKTCLSKIVCRIIFLSKANTKNPTLIYRWHNYTSFWDDLSTMSQAWSTVWLPTDCGYAQGASAKIFSLVSFK